MDGSVHNTELLRSSSGSRENALAIVFILLALLSTVFQKLLHRTPHTRASESQNPLGNVRKQELNEKGE